MKKIECLCFCVQILSNHNMNKTFDWLRITFGKHMSQLNMLNIDGS